MTWVWSRGPIFRLFQDRSTLEISLELSSRSPENRSMVKKNVITIKRSEAIKNYEGHCFDLIAEASINKESTEMIQTLSVDLAKNLLALRDELTSFSRIKYLCQRAETPMFFSDECFGMFVEADQDGQELNVVILNEDGSSLGYLSNKDLAW
jgi:hypothetical protein